MRIEEKTGHSFSQGVILVNYDWNCSIFDVQNYWCLPKSIELHLIFLPPNLYDHVRDWRENRRGYQVKFGHFYFLRGLFWWIYSWNFSIFDLQNSRCVSKSVGMYLIFLTPNLYDHVRHWQENGRGYQVKIGHFHFLRGDFGEFSAEISAFSTFRTRDVY